MADFADDAELADGGAATVHGVAEAEFGGGDPVDPDRFAAFVEDGFLVADGDSDFFSGLGVGGAVAAGQGGGES